jgi:hypothetical protein
MPRRAIDSTFAGLLAVALIFVLGTGWFVEVLSHAPQSQTAQTPAHDGTSKKHEPIGPWEWLTHDPVAVATLVLALVTALMTRAVFKQVSLARDQIKQAGDEFQLAQKEFIATHRPKLILRDAFSLITDPLESKISVTYTVTNVGASDCWMTECHLGIELVSELKYPLFVMTPDMVYPSAVPFIGRISAGESKRFTFVDPKQGWEQSYRQKWPAIEAGVHFVGHIIYIDAPGSSIRRQMAFRRKYNIETQRFHRIWITDNEHEYSD